MVIFKEYYLTMIVLVGFPLLVISGSAVGLVSDLAYSPEFQQWIIIIVITTDFVNSKKGGIHIEPESISYKTCFKQYLNPPFAIFPPQKLTFSICVPLHLSVPLHPS